MNDAEGGGAMGGGAGGAPAVKLTKSGKPSTRKPKFTVVDHLLGPNGIAYVYNVIPEKYKARSIHWFPYDRVGVVNADP
jgi:hypothetical protein